MDRLQTQQWSDETETLLEQAREGLTRSTSETVREMASTLAETRETGEAPIRIAFAGQYGSGKSTIIRALTGRDDIQVGAGITTDRVQDYGWNGIIITDTPGIHTSIRPEHDWASYRAISQADLLVFVITNELFDEHIGQHYRRLTIDNDKAHETVVVVNKMDRHSLGNSPESQAIITEALREPLSPFSPEDTRLTFTDANSALDADNEPDAEIAGMLREQGNMNALVNSLNELIQDKGLVAKHTTRLYSINQVLNEALEMEESGDSEADALLLVYNQNIRTISQSATSLRGGMELAVARAKGRIRRVADEVNDILDSDRNGDGEKQAKETAQSRIKEATQELDAEMERAMQDALPELQSRIETMQRGGLHQDAMLRIQTKGEGNGRTKGLSLIQALAERVGETVAGMAQNDAAMRAGITGLRQFSGGPAHSAILGIGRTFGHSFRPWEAVRLTQTLGRAAGVLGIAATVMGVAWDIKEEIDLRKREREVLEARQDVRAEFDRIASEVEREAGEISGAAIRELLDEPLEAITKARDELNAARQEVNERLERLNRVVAAVSELIGRIHSGDRRKDITPVTPAE